MAEKTQGELLKEKLYYKQKNGYDILSDEKISEINSFCDGYKKFLDKGKTEREVVRETVLYLKQKGFREYKFGEKYETGDGLYINNRNKALIILRMGEQTVDNGVNIIAAHIDSPRIDIKQRPLYEDSGFAYFKTHYYGGIKKYQWVATPLSLHGVIIKADGTSIDICIGEDVNDPVFCITDLLPHLGKEQATKPLYEGIPGESLNIMIGSRSFKDDKVNEKVKLNILNILNEKYGITEADFISAELSIVPAFNAKDIGFDRSLVGAYGQDDRVCAYGPLVAIVENSDIENTAMLILADKEEIGSVGNTGMQSMIFRDLMIDMARVQAVSESDVFAHSKCLSADVNACFDPNFGDVYDPKNSPYINFGVVMTKFTGSRGKSGSSDAHAEFIAEIRKIFDDGEVLWQTGELGKVDQGGGGTVAAYIAYHNIDVLDVGVPILSMHAPYEIASKVDIFMMYKAAKVFFI